MVLEVHLAVVNAAGAASAANTTTVLSQVALEENFVPQDLPVPTYPFIVNGARDGQRYKIKMDLSSASTSEEGSCEKPELGAKLFVDGQRALQRATDVLPLRRGRTRWQEGFQTRYERNFATGEVKQETREFVFTIHEGGTVDCTGGRGNDDEAVAQERGVVKIEVYRLDWQDVPGHNRKTYRGGDGEDAVVATSRPTEDLAVVPAGPMSKGKDVVSKTHGSGRGHGSQGKDGACSSTASPSPALPALSSRVDSAIADFDDPGFDDLSLAVPQTLRTRPGDVQHTKSYRSTKGGARKKPFPVEHLYDILLFYGGDDEMVVSSRLVLRSVSSTGRNS